MSRDPSSRSRAAQFSIVKILVNVSASLAFGFCGCLHAENCGAAWQIFPSPNLSGNNELYGIDATSANDIWAVGRYDDGTGYKTMSLHWNGNGWTIVPTPNVGSAFNHMYSVAAISTNNVWSVGASSDQNLVYKPLITHWDGTAWAVVPAAIAPGSAAFLYGIAAIAPNDVWAVGYIQVGFSAQQPLAMHWDGTQWNLVPTPSTSPANKDILWGITALATNDIWATGSSTDAVTNELHTFVQHWDGSAWSIVASPNPSGSIYNFIWGITAVSPNDIWMMGRAYVGGSYPSLIEHWNGTAWNISPSPSLEFYNELYDAAALSSNDVWAVGRYGGGYDNNIAMVMHWNGSAWNVVDNPNPPGATENNFLYSVKAISSHNVWAVGACLKDERFQTMIERYSDIPCLSPNAIVSRKTHGGGGAYDVDLANNGVECRSGGANGDYTVVFTFPDLLTNVDGATVSSGTGSVSHGAIGSDAHEYVVDLTGVSNAQTITIRLTNVNGVANISGNMRVLVGDTTNDGTVNSADIAQTKSQSGQAIGSANFREDITTDGNLNSADIALAKSRSGTGLP